MFISFFMLHQFVFLLLSRVDVNGTHGDNFPFRTRTLAHAFFPRCSGLCGDVHYNTLQNFSSMEPPPSHSKYGFESSFYFYRQRKKHNNSLQWELAFSCLKKNTIIMYNLYVAPISANMLLTGALQSNRIAIFKSLHTN